MWPLYAILEWVDLIVRCDVVTTDNKRTRTAIEYQLSIFHNLISSSSLARGTLKKQAAMQVSNMWGTLHYLKKSRKLSIVLILFVIFSYSVLPAVSKCLAYWTLHCSLPRVFAPASLTALCLVNNVKDLWGLFYLQGEVSRYGKTKDTAATPWVRVEAWP